MYLEETNVRQVYWRKRRRRRRMRMNRSATYGRPALIPSRNRRTTYGRLGELTYQA
jgi:hypothetical protein